MSIIYCTLQAMLTWTLFGLAESDPGLMKEIQAEVRTVMAGKDRPDYDDIVKMKKLRMALIEALRLYPEPPVLIRRAREEDTLPSGGSGLGPIKVLRGTDIFISTWNLHRAPEYWENPEKYDPTRWERPFHNPGIKGWNGYDPNKMSAFMLYPNEITSDFAFLPFGAGKRKCIGDQFAVLEASVTMVSSTCIAFILVSYHILFVSHSYCSIFCDAKLVNDHEQIRLHFGGKAGGRWNEDRGNNPHNEWTEYGGNSSIRDRSYTRDKRLVGAATHF